MKRILVCGAIALGAATLAAAVLQEPAIVTGRVTTETGAPLAGALVRIEALQVGTSSRADGRYRLVVPFSRLRAAGRYAVMTTRTGYQRETRQVQLTPGATATQDFQLRTAAVSLQGVVVAPRSAPTAMPADVGTYELSRVESPPPPQHYATSDFNTENYAAIDENPFLAVRANALSTFSIDVDRASYSNVRRFLRLGQRPPRDAVRIEELVNYFRYDYAEPTGEHPFSVAAEVGPCPWNSNHRLMRVGLQGRHVDTRELPPSNLVFLIDVSGSMQPANKLPLVKDALRMLVEQLRPQDRISLVVYAGAAGLVLDATPGDRKGDILSAIDRLEAGGSTAGGAGIRLAYEVARRNFVRGGNNRVILATDGDFNVGASSDAEMFRLIEEKRQEGTFLTVLGFGMGNLKDNRLEGLADRGNGNYAYVDDRAEARKTLVSEFGGTLFTIAKDVKLQVEFNPARVAAYRLIGYENRALRNEEFDDDRRDAGDMGAGHSVTALYEIVPVGARMDVEARTPELRYQRTEPAPRGGGTDELAFVKLRYKLPDSETSRLFSQPVLDRGAAPDDDFRFASAVAGFGMLLRDSRHKGGATVDGMLEIARGALGPDREGYRREFVALAERYRRIARGEHVDPEYGDVAER
ncbi:MAG TPA: von Willebrand factor type A domain-containing protein [Longimicrobiaceae bacterium]|nr:von Willebrand factor type A domain-containing protein [Longimicrobiaceae bacterium]